MRDSNSIRNKTTKVLSDHLWENYGFRVDSKWILARERAGKITGIPRRDNGFRYYSWDDIEGIYEAFKPGGPGEYHGPPEPKAGVRRGKDVLENLRHDKRKG